MFWYRKSLRSHLPKSRFPNDDVCGSGWTSTGDCLGISALEAVPCPELCESVWKRCSARIAGPWRWCLHAAACWGRREHRAVPSRTGPSGQVLGTRFRWTTTPWRDANSLRGSTASQLMKLSSPSRAPLPDRVEKVEKCEERSMKARLTHWLNGEKVGIRWHMSRMILMIITQDCSPVALAYVGGCQGVMLA